MTFRQWWDRFFAARQYHPVTVISRDPDTVLQWCTREFGYKPKEYVDVPGNITFVNGRLVSVRCFYLRTAEDAAAFNAKYNP